MADEKPALTDAQRENLLRQLEACDDFELVCQIVDQLDEAGRGKYLRRTGWTPHPEAESATMVERYLEIARISEKMPRSERRELMRAWLKDTGGGTKS